MLNSREQGFILSNLAFVLTLKKQKNLYFYKKSMIDTTEALQPQFFIFNLPLYTKVVMNNEDIASFMNLMQLNTNINEYNPVIKEPTTYKVVRNPVTHRQYYDDSFRAFQGIREFELKCVRSELQVNIYVYVGVKVVDGKSVFTITKIGQNPSIADFHISQIKDYSSVLSKDELREFTKAIGLAANGVGIGSFVYLRRIFENQIEKAHQAAIEHGKLDETQYHKNRIPEKIDQLKEYLPEFLVEHKSLYSILSKGVHELSEQECLIYFDTVKVGIEMILDEKVEIYAKKRKIELARAKILAATKSLK